MRLDDPIVGGGVVKKDGDTPILITEAQQSYEEQYAARRRKYALTMGARFPCLLGAALTFNYPWVCLAFVVLSVPLPWIAVLIANDRPPKKSEKVNKFRPEKPTKVLESKAHPVIDSTPED
ncbi:DUF3099 domain-containing protein [Pseudonocardiaceae bacterium YIM PH 21723]|nr:DUF3099 domain-containing protein [Pseudonocardiaceae bacterium YIM PH 21723]